MPDELALNWAGNGGAMSRAFEKLFLPSLEEQPSVTPAPDRIFHRLFVDEKIIVGATDGMKTMAEARGVFTGYLDPNFKSWGTDKSCQQATKPTKAVIYELWADATFSQMCGSFADLNTLVWEQSQIVKFCQEHSNKLRQGVNVAFFHFKVGDELFVALVDVFAGGLRALVRRFGHDHVWRAGNGRLVVVPQL
jgi:hypothetical protein